MNCSELFPSLHRFCSFVLICLITPFLIGGCTVAKVGRAWFQSTSSFYKCTTDYRIWCQPGSEKLALAILPAVDEAQRTIEIRQYCQFVKPIIIRTYATRDDFSRYSGAANYANGAVSLGVLHLSPKLLSTPERIPGIVTHEFSHLNLALKLGTWSWANIPGWFHEGFATWVSNGGGAETVTREEAINSIKSGHSFLPEDQGSPLMPKSAASYNLKPHMYYRQAEIFVGYIHDINPAAFELFLIAIEQGKSFSMAMESTYGENVDLLWKQFIVKTRE